MPSIQKMSPFLWFDHQAEEAANFYVGIFRNSRIVRVSRYPGAGEEGHGQTVGDPDPVKVSRAIAAMMKMKKIDIETVRRAHAGE